MRAERTAWIAATVTPCASHGADALRSAPAAIDAAAAAASNAKPRRVATITLFAASLRDLAEGRSVQQSFRTCVRLAARRAPALCAGAAPALRALLALFHHALARLPAATKAHKKSGGRGGAEAAGGGLRFMCRATHILSVRPLRECVWRTQLRSLWLPLCRALFR